MPKIISASCSHHVYGMSSMYVLDHGKGTKWRFELGCSLTILIPRSVAATSLRPRVTRWYIITDLPEYWKILLMPGFRWDGATCDPLQHSTVMFPSLMHDVWCQQMADFDDWRDVFPSNREYCAACKELKTPWWMRIYQRIALRGWGIWKRVRHG